MAAYPGRRDELEQPNGIWLRKGAARVPRRHNGKFKPSQFVDLGQHMGAIVALASTSMQ